MIIGWKEKNYTKGTTYMALDTFGKRLRALRQDRGLSQIDLRDRMEKECGVNIGGAYISELERSDRTPPLATAAAMAKVLNVTLDYLGLLIEDGELSYTRHDEPVNYITPEADQVAQMADTMRAEERAILFSLARNLAIVSGERKRNEAEARELLDSVERTQGRDARMAVERRLLRGKGLPVDGGAQDSGL